MGLIARPHGVIFVRDFFRRSRSTRKRLRALRRASLLLHCSRQTEEPISAQ